MITDYSNIAINRIPDEIYLAMIHNGVNQTNETWHTMLNISTPENVKVNCISDIEMIEWFKEVQQNDYKQYKQSKLENDLSDDLDMFTSWYKGLGRRGKVSIGRVQNYVIAAENINRLGMNLWSYINLCESLNVYGLCNKSTIKDINENIEKFEELSQSNKMLSINDFIQV